MRIRHVLAAVVLLVVAALAAAALALRAIDLDALRAAVAEEARAATGRELRVAGAIEIRPSLRPRLRVDGVTFANAPWGSRPSMLSLDRLEVEVALVPLLRGRLHVRRLRLRGVDLLLETSADGEANWVFTGSGASESVRAAGSTALPPIDEVRIEEALLVWRDGRTGVERRLTLPRLVARAGEDDRLRVEAKGDFAGRALGVEGTVVSPAALTRGGPVPLEAAARWGGNHLSVKGTLDADGRPPRLELAVVSERLDLRDFGARGSPPPSGSPRTRVLEDRELPVEPFPDLEADVDLRVKELRTPSTRIEALETNLSLADGALEIGPLTAGVAGGVLRAEATLRPADGKLALDGRMRLDGFRMRELLADGTPPVVDGEGTFEAVLAGRGSSLRALVADLDGRTTFRLRNGRLRGRSIDLLAADLVTSVGGWFSREADTRLGCVLSRFDIRDGVAESRALLLDSERVRVLGGGRIDLRSEMLDLTLVPRPREASLVSLAVPVRVRGTLAHPSFTPDRLAVAKKVGGAVLGAVFFPPAVLVALSDLGAGDDDPCLEALAGEAITDAGGGGIGGFVRGLRDRIDQSLDGVRDSFR